MAKISIITVNHDAHRFIELCVKAVHMRTKLDAPHTYQHIVIDNGSNQNTIRMLNEFANKRWIRLIKRTIMKGASGHAMSLDWILQSEPSELVCLLDSDAYPVKNNWLNYLTQMINGSVAAGFPHFRDESLLHPSCMLFRYKDYWDIGRPSFAIKTVGKFWDTGMIVCDKMRSHGCHLIPIPKEKMSEYVLHRWCGTRIENERRDALDGVVPKVKFNQETEAWFRNPSAVEALNHES